MRQLFSRCPRKFRWAACVGIPLLLTAVQVPAAWAQGQIFVANYTGDSITVYPRTAAGEVAPSYTIPAQLGDAPHQVAINHRAGELIVANTIADSVAVYDLATGARKRTISGPATGLSRPTGVAVDEVNGEVYVANDFGNSVTVYDILASNDTPPKRTIRSPYLIAPVGLAIDLMHDEIVVAGYGYSNVATFERLANGDTTPKRLIIGVGLELPQGIALDLVNDEILVANSAYQTPNAGSILAFRRTDSGIVPPLRRLEGSATQLCNPMSVAVDRATNELVVANANFGLGSCSQSVTTYTRTATGNAAPKRVLAGAFAALYHPISAAITSASSVTVKVKAAKSSVGVTDSGGVGYSISAIASGGPVFNVSLTDTLPAGVAWSLTSSPDASACNLSVLDRRLTCTFGDLEKGTTKTIQVSGVPTTASCPGITNQATAFYNDGTADLTGTSTAAITIKCK